ncbi:MAG: sdhD [Francisellaceae bacterium]|nr:sdhD [Francisellaceae bacterium]
MALNNRGLKYWVIQRLSALFLLVYTLYFVFYFFHYSPVHYNTWHHLFTLPLIRYGNILILIGMLWHAWIGLWTIISDYIKFPKLRLLSQFLVGLALIYYLFWGLEVVGNV